MSADQQAAEMLAKARGLLKRAFDAKGRAYRRTPGTATALREHAKSEEYRDRADALFDEILNHLANRSA